MEAINGESFLVNEIKRTYYPKSNRPDRELWGTSYTLNEGSDFVDSIEFVQQQGLVHLPTYAMTIARGFDEHSSTIATNGMHITLGEKIFLRVQENRYLHQDGTPIPGGLYWIDIQNGGFFMPRPQKIREQMESRRLSELGFWLNDSEVDMLLGDKCVYKHNGKKLEEVPLTHFFDTYEQFQEESETFRAGFREGLANVEVTYAVLQNFRSFYFDINLNRFEYGSRNFLIPCGGKPLVDKMALRYRHLPYSCGKESRYTGRAMASFTSTEIKPNSGIPIALLPHTINSSEHQFNHSYQIPAVSYRDLKEFHLDFDDENLEEFSDQLEEVLFDDQ